MRVTPRSFRCSRKCWSSKSVSWCAKSCTSSGCVTSRPCGSTSPSNQSTSTSSVSTNVIPGALEALRDNIHNEESVSMERTLVGVFESNREAEAVKQELLQMGLPQGQVQVHAGGEGNEDASTGRKPGFFERLFGGTDARTEHASQYFEAVQQGHCVVVVNAVSDERVDEAARIMSAHGAIDVDERAASWRQGTSGTSTASSADGTEDERGAATGGFDRSLPERGVEAVKRGAE